MIDLDKPIKCGKYIQYFKTVMLCDYDYNVPVMIEVEV